MASEIPDWKIVKDPGFNDCFYVDFGKRIIRYNPNFYWVRYSGTRRHPEIYGYAIRSETEEDKQCLTCVFGSECLLKKVKEPCPGYEKEES